MSEASGADIVALLRDRLDPPDAPQGAPSRSDFDLNGGFGGSRETRPAAVLAPLVERDGEWRMVLTHRAAHLSNHAGQIAFPGGRMDEADDSLAAAALREAHEEIGLAPQRVELLGSFEPYETVTRFAITPFVGVAPPDFAAQPDPREVAGVFEAPLAFLMDSANHQLHSGEWRGVRRFYYAIPYEDHYIWGATAGMIRALHDRLYG